MSTTSITKHEADDGSEETLEGVVIGDKDVENETGNDNQPSTSSSPTKEPPQDEIIQAVKEEILVKTETSSVLIEEIEKPSVSVHTVKTEVVVSTESSVTIATTTSYQIVTSSMSHG